MREARGGATAVTQDSMTDRPAAERVARRPPCAAFRPRHPAHPM
jgi:hypothetical protein